MKREHVTCATQFHLQCDEVDSRSRLQLAVGIVDAPAEEAVGVDLG